MTLVDEHTTIDEVNLELNVPCEISKIDSCSQPARWVTYLDCGATGNPSCDAHMKEYMGLLGSAHNECICLLGHIHLVGEVQCRRL